jgi:phosphatidylinositol alpha 1,6-mannosyltransferase
LNQDILRVAFFPDTYHEVDGVANTSRQFQAFAERRGLPFLTVCGGTQNNVGVGGSVTTIECCRSRFAFAVDKKHEFDLAFSRQYRPVEDAVSRFGPDIVHITGPSDVGMMGALIAHRLRIPLAASWHTNLHQYAEERAAALLGWLPRSVRTRMGAGIRRGSLLAILRFYRIAQILFAPNRELVDLLEAGTGKTCYLMQRGVDTALFDPTRRDRRDDSLVLGYVGRLTVEKNIHFLAELETALESAGVPNFRFLIVGQGAAEGWLKAHMRRATFAGVLQGEALARAYANMDVFVFPSRTDTFGNVVLESLASGVPAIVSDSGGPRFVVEAGETGFVARDVQEFVKCIKELAARRDRLDRMRSTARAYALASSWDRVFEAVYAGYERGLKNCHSAGKKVRVRPRSAVCAGAGNLG